MCLKCQLYNEKCSINLKSVKYVCVNFQFQECIIFTYLYKIKSQVSPIVVPYHFIKHANIFSAVLLHIFDQHDTSIKTRYLLTCSLFSEKYSYIVTPVTTLKFLYPAVQMHSSFVKLYHRPCCPTKFSWWPSESRPITQEYYCIIIMI